MISAGWLLHTAWDVLHQPWELPIVRWLPTFFVECAVADTLLALWMLRGTPGIFR